MILKFLIPLWWIRALRFILFFMKEVVVANLDVAKLVLFVPNEKIYPGIVRMPLDVETDAEIFLLTMMITLTPGTTNLGLAPDRKSLILYVLHSEDPEKTAMAIKSSFEKRIFEVLR